MDSLIHAGYVEVSASKPARHERDLASLEVEVDREKEKTLTSDEAGAFAAAVVADPKGREHRPYYKPADSMAHVRSLIGRTIHDEIDLEAELRSGDHVIDDLQRQALLDQLRRTAA